MGASLRDRATHEQSPQAVSAVPVGIPSAGACAGKNVGGRPAHFPGETKTAAIAVRTAPSVRDALKRAAEENGRSITKEVEYRLLKLFDDEMVAGKLDEIMSAIKTLTAQGMSAGTAETAQQAQGEARQPGPKDAPEPSIPSTTASRTFQ